jgi:hypothetical protein
MDSGCCQLRNCDVSISQRLVKCIEDKIANPILDDQAVSKSRSNMCSEFSDFLQIASQVAELIISERPLLHSCFTSRWSRRW